MNRTLFWILISLATFVFGIATVFFWLNSSTETISLHSQKSETPPEQPIINYCELANNPEKYDGKIVRVNTKLWFMMHGYFFLSKDCEDETKQAAVIFPKGKLGLEIENKIAKDTGLDEYNPWGFPEIIAVGKFTRVEPSRKSDSMENNTYLHFEIIEVEKASKQ